MKQRNIKVTKTIFVCRGFDSKKQQKKSKIYSDSNMNLLHCMIYVSLLGKLLHVKHFLPHQL